MNIILFQLVIFEKLQKLQKQKSYFFTLGCWNINVTLLLLLLLVVEIVVAFNANNANKAKYMLGIL